MKNIGLIGCGNIAETYFRAQEYFNNINFVACADKVPEAAIVPVAKEGSYFLSNITGSANNVIITTEAPIIPVVAAIIVPIIVTERARPPGTFFNKTCKQYNKSFATPLLSSMVPININIGTATKIKFSQTKSFMKSIFIKNSKEMD